MTWKPHVTVAAIAERDGRFLVVEEEADGRIVFNQPAGHLDEGETLIAAVIRETLEETAWHFEPQAVTGIYLYPSSDNGMTYLRICFQGRCTSKLPGHTLDTGIIRALWLSRDELAGLDNQLRSPMVLACIDDYLAGNRYPLESLKYLPDPGL